MEHHPVIAGFNRFQDFALDLAEGQLKLRLLFQAHPLLCQGRLVQRKAEELLGGWKQGKQHAAGQVQHAPGADAVPWHGVRLPGASRWLIPLGD